MAGGPDAKLRNIQGTTPYVLVGIITEIEEHADFGYLLTVEVQPGDGRVIQARLCALGSGNRKGMFWPVEVGDEVLVLLPDGEPHRAVALPGLVSGAAAPPASWGNDHVEVVHANGMEVRRTDGAPTSAVVLATILPELLKALVAITSNFATLGLPPHPDLSNFALRVSAEVDKSPALFAESIE